MSSVGVLVLAGGRSSRMGYDKRRLRLWGNHGPTLLEHTIALALHCCSDVLVALNDPEQWPQIHVPTVGDRWADVGPLGGMAAGFAALQTPWVLVLAADLPCLTHATLQALLAQPRIGDVVVPRHASGAYEPLVALYRRATLARLEKYVLMGGRSLHEWLHWLAVQAWQPTAVDAAVWRNLNTPADVELLGTRS